MASHHVGLLNGRGKVIAIVRVERGESHGFHPGTWQKVRAIADEHALYLIDLGVPFEDRTTTDKHVPTTNPPGSQHDNGNDNTASIGTTAATARNDY